MSRPRNSRDEIRHRLAARRGKKRAAVAIAHSILIIAYYMIRNGTHYVERGATYFDQRNQQVIQRRLVRRLEQYR